jgi:putative endonuclease
MSNRYNNVLYTGITNNLLRRVSKHKIGNIKGFTRKYNVSKLVYYEVFEDAYNAIKREKQIKAGSRKKKIDLITNTNPKWENLFYFFE